MSQSEPGASSGYRIGLPRRQALPMNAPPALGETRSILVASPAVKAVYVLALLAVLVAPGATSAWVALTLGGGLLGIAALPVAALALWRIAQVLLAPHTLDAPVVTGVAKWLRVPGLALAAISALTVPAVFLLRLLGRVIAPHGSDNGMEFYLVGLGVALLAGIAPVGLLLFEFSRLRGFEQAFAESTPATDVSPQAAGRVHR